MSLMKFFFSRQVLQNPIDTDPLQHPDLVAMSLRELADLPLMPENLGRTIVDASPTQPLIRPPELAGRRPPSPRLPRGNCI